MCNISTLNQLILKMDGAEIRDLHPAVEAIDELDGAPVAAKPGHKPVCVKSETTMSFLTTLS